LIKIKPGEECSRHFTATAATTPDAVPPNTIKSKLSTLVALAQRRTHMQIAKVVIIVPVILMEVIMKIMGKKKHIQGFETSHPTALDASSLASVTMRVD